jgi:hypothetical protein
MQYASLKSAVRLAAEPNGQPLVTLPVELFHRVLASALRSRSGFDETYYLSKYPDVRAAVNNGTLQSGEDHYILTGYFEDRFPRRIIVDEGYYLSENRDVAEALRSGAVKSAQVHFEFAGFSEGRSPHKDFSLL